MKIKSLLTMTFSLMAAHVAVAGGTYAITVLCNNQPANWSHIEMWHTGDVDPGMGYFVYITGMNNIGCSVGPSNQNHFAVGFPVKHLSHEAAVIAGWPTYMPPPQTMLQYMPRIVPGPFNPEAPRPQFPNFPQPNFQLPNLQLPPAPNFSLPW